MDRQNVEYIHREESDDEFDEVKVSQILLLRMPVSCFVSVRKTKKERGKEN